MVVSHASDSATLRRACTGLRTCPRALLPTNLLGNARNRAPMSCAIAITINSTALLWTWTLTSLAVGAVLPGGMRSTRLRLHVLLDSFTDVVHLADTTALSAAAAAPPLLPRFRSAPYHRGHVWPLGGASPRARTVARPAGRTPLRGGQRAGPPSTCTTATSSTAAWASHSQAPRAALVAT